MAAPQDTDALAVQLAAIASEAGRFLGAVTDRGAGRITKPDGTSATAADLAAERIILTRLAEAYPAIPVVAEESAGRDPGGPVFFLVDPLDGTSDFLAGGGEFSVNIALVQGGRPVAAAIAVPFLDRIWAAGRQAWWMLASRMSEDVGERHPAAVAPPGSRAPIALVSRRHGDSATESCLSALQVGERRTVSSAAKFCLIASGDADIYVRCGPTMEWDTAAGDHLVTAAGGCVVGPDGAALTYGHAGRGFRNGPFAALADPSLAPRVRLPARAVSRERGRS